MADGSWLGGLLGTDPSKLDLNDPDTLAALAQAASAQGGAAPAQSPGPDQSAPTPDQTAPAQPPARTVPVPVSQQGGNVDPRAGLNPLQGVHIGKDGYARPNPLRVALDMVGGMAPMQAIDYERVRPLMGAYGIYQQQLIRQVAGGIQDPQQRAAFLLNPQPYLAADAEASKPQKAGPGDVITGGFNRGVLNSAPALVKQGEYMLKPTNGSLVGGVSPAPLVLGPSQTAYNQTTGGAYTAPAAPATIGPDQSLVDGRGNPLFHGASAPVVTTTPPGSTTSVIDPNAGLPAPASGTSGAPTIGSQYQITPNVVRAIVGEAGGEGPTGQQAVLGVMMNRARLTGQSLEQVATAAGQFSSMANPKISGLDPASHAYQSVASNIAPLASGQIANPAGTADHFYAPKLMPTPPKWAQGQQGTDIGNQRFYTLGSGSAGLPGGTQSGAQSAPAPGTPGVRVAVQGGQPHTLTPQEVLAKHLTPGVWEQGADGALSLKAPFDKDEWGYVSDLNKAASVMDGMRATAQRFSQANRNTDTGIQYVGGEDNPLAIYAMSQNPDLKYMNAAHNQESLGLKDPTIGRLMKSELPMIEASAQDIGANRNVNDRMAAEYTKASGFLSAKSQFMQNWLFSHGSLLGAPQVWDQDPSNPLAQRAQPQQQAAAPQRPTAPRKGGVPAAQAAGYPGARQAPDGKWYAPDPNRPGKYLLVH